MTQQNKWVRMKFLHIIFGIIIFGLAVNFISALANNGTGLKSSIISLVVIGSIWAIVAIVDYHIKHKNYENKDNNKE